MTRDGKAKTRSFARMTTSSTHPPARAAARSPRGTPASRPMPTATTATAMEVRAPTMIIDRTSRPRWSVPSQWAAEGPRSLLGTSTPSTG
jgi:hypothetical protein